MTIPLLAALSSPAVQLLSSRSIADVQKAIAARVIARLGKRSRREWSVLKIQGW